MFSIGSFVIIYSLLQLRSLTKLNDFSNLSYEYFFIIFQVGSKLIKVLENQALIIV